MFFPHNFIISENELPVTLFSTNDSILETIGPQAEAKKFPGGTRETEIKNSALLVMEAKLSP